MVRDQGQELGAAGSVQWMADWARVWNAMAAEMSDYAKWLFEDGAATFEAVLGARDFEHALDLQRAYLARCYDANVKQVSKLGGMYAGLARETTTALEAFPRRVQS